MITVQQGGEKPESLQMIWEFRAKRGEEFLFKLRSKANGKAAYTLRLEGANGSNRWLEKEVVVTNTTSSHRFQSGKLTADAACRLVFLFGKAASGSTVWIDDVELIPVNAKNDGHRKFA